MRGNQTIVINGKVYDAITGLPMAAPHAPAKTPAVKPVVPTAPASVIKVSTPASSGASRSQHHAKSAHHATQKSVTLRRDVLKKPAVTAHTGTARRKPAPGHIARSGAITKFAPHPQPLKSARSLDIKPVKHAPQQPHSIVAQKHALVHKPVVASAPKLNSRSLKEQLISERLAAVDTTPAKAERRPKKSFFARQPRAASVLAASLAIMIFGGYLTYLNMPGLSVRVAAAQADVAATFPDYHPDGYRFDGPVAFAPGQVSINFAANGGTGKYTVTEQKSSWDSQAVYDNVVAVTDDKNYVTNSQQGLTIYTFDSKAAWVNKGILYTIDGDAPLSKDQLLKIAASL